ncbi:MAG: prepilin-type N-terminal cleavage/methylation domain-containing protein [Candidatus Hinthialibacter antarcticus]|nr:prepilin-type N-terminal cleavage/methylation domain-containing protein [Candidatus Hinthialibacter antarcticus]
MQRKSDAYSLIELLVVVAIIGILTTVSVRQLGMAKIRAEVARVQSDFHNVGVAINLYKVDSGSYPATKLAKVSAASNYVQAMFELTTPTAYINQLPDSPWLGKNLHLNVLYYAQRFYERSNRYNEDWDFSYDYTYYTKDAMLHIPMQTKPNWSLTSHGPTGIGSSATHYNSSNGTLSNGAVFHHDY